MSSARRKKALADGSCETCTLAGRCAKADDRSGAKSIRADGEFLMFYCSNSGGGVQRSLAVALLRALWLLGHPFCLYLSSPAPLCPFPSLHAPAQVSPTATPYPSRNGAHTRLARSSAKNARSAIAHSPSSSGTQETADGSRRRRSARPAQRSRGRARRVCWISSTVCRCRCAMRRWGGRTRRLRAILISVSSRSRREVAAEAHDGSVVALDKATAG